MRAIIQRVTRASVTVNGGEPRAIGPGLVILLGVRETDEIDIVPKLADKCAHLRIFEDEDGKLNRSAVELGYSALVVSNFTLYGDTARGKRQASAMPPRGNWRCRAMKNSLMRWTGRVCRRSNTANSARTCRSTL